MQTQRNRADFLLSIAVFLLLTLCVCDLKAVTVAGDSISQPTKHRFEGIEVTPVEIDENAPEQPRLHYYDLHGDPLEEPVYFLAALDTATKAAPKAVYPKFNALGIGVNFADAIMRLASQKHSNFDLRADLSLFNWFFPVIEVGIGFADSKPDYGRFSYKSSPAFYSKVGFNYNFLYKSNPAYQAFIGFRAAFSSFHYDILGMNGTSDYWTGSKKGDLCNQSANCWYGEALAGLRVKLGGPVYMGWTIGYNFKFKLNKPTNSTPWFIPGYGATSPLHFTLSLYYVIPFHSGAPKSEEKNK